MSRQFETGPATTQTFPFYWCTMPRGFTGATKMFNHILPSQCCTSRTGAAIALPWNEALTHNHWMQWRQVKRQVDRFPSMVNIDLGK